MREVAVLSGSGSLASSVNISPLETEPAWPLTGAAQYANKCLFDYKTARAVVYNLSDKHIECSSVLKSGNISEVCGHMTHSSCRYVVVRKTRKSRWLQKESVTVVLVWLPRDAPLAERVKYRARLADFCAQLGHYDHVVAINEWYDFSRSTIMARISEEAKAAAKREKRLSAPL
ncbi:hypothetical protein H4R18_003690 [Coemansia javaensis]|uniref:ADF-H domain-containing protein n=1 Tax=Coemansia javaensis TaxID=2761396 RepID=A0A9W8H696_9FUNG|nr:hypothetical protein H4R18_003690 [Coemansia javaensis]